MKNILVALCLVLSISFQAQETIVKKDTSYWKKSGLFGLNLAQTAVSNWTGGGENNIAFSGLINIDANYKKGKVEWANRFDGQYGIVKVGHSKIWQKNVDQMFAMSKYSLYAFKKYWFYTLMADFRSQFSDGYKYSGDTLKWAISRFASPAYIQLALGLDFKPADYFVLTLSPVAGKITMVSDQVLSNAGEFGVQKAVYDSAGVLTTPGHKFRYEFGGRVTLKFKKDLTKQFSVEHYAGLSLKRMKYPNNFDCFLNHFVDFK